MDKSSRSIEVLRFDRLHAANRALAERIAATATEAVRRRGRFVLALSGGRTPRGLFRLLAEEFKTRIPWGRTHLFWGDERFVPRTDPASNYQMAYINLISKIPVLAPNIYPAPIEISPPDRSAAAYENTLREFFEAGGTEAIDETFDAILLGVGPDGHTASLFPGNSVLEEQERWVRSVLAPPSFAVRRRITLTLPAINASRLAFFLASGPDKKEVIETILGNPEEAGLRFPAARIQPRIRTTWVVAGES